MTFRNRTPRQQLVREKNKTLVLALLLTLFAVTFLAASCAGLVYGEIEYRKEGAVSPKNQAILYWGVLGVMLGAGIFLTWQSFVQYQVFRSIAHAIRILDDYRDTSSQPDSRAPARRKKKKRPGRK